MQHDSNTKARAPIESDNTPNITLTRPALWRLTVLAFLMGMVSEAGLHQAIMAAIALVGAA